MNEYHSSRKWKYIPRWLTGQLETACHAHPVVIITGPRQVGKSTLLQNAAPTREWPFLTLDELDTLDQAHRDPTSLLFGKDRLIIDEVQKAPRLLSEIKRHVDRSNRQARVVLSGSANLLLMKQVSETLAGRAVYLTLDSMAWGEANSQHPTKILNLLLQNKWPIDRRIDTPRDTAEIISRGMAPPLLAMPDQAASIRWWEGYTATFLERDLRSISQIESLPDFRRLMTALALRSGQLLNQTEVSRDISLAQPTIHRYINLLEVMLLLYRLPPFTLNRTKRLVKTPKIYWFDAALAAFLSGYYDPENLRKAREWGSFFETLVFQHLRVWCVLQTPRPRLYFWRTNTGKEVDFVIEHGRQLLAIEVKADQQARHRDVQNLQLFLDEYSDMAVAGILVYTGTEVKRMAEKIIAIPWQMLT